MTCTTITPVLRLDDIGRRVAAYRQSRDLRSEQEARNPWVVAMYEAMETGGIRVKQVLIDRTRVP